MTTRGENISIVGILLAAMSPFLVIGWQVAGVGRPEADCPIGFTERQVMGYNVCRQIVEPVRPTCRPGHVKFWNEWLGKYVCLTGYELG